MPRRVEWIDKKGRYPRTLGTRETLEDSVAARMVARKLAKYVDKPPKSEPEPEPEPEAKPEPEEDDDAKDEAKGYTTKNFAKPPKHRAMKKGKVIRK